MTEENKTEEQVDHAKQQARAKLDHIVIMVQRLKHQEDCEFDNTGECDLTDKQIIEGLDKWYKEGAVSTEEQKRRYHDHDAAEDEINEGPLSVEVRTGWYVIGEEKPEPEEFKILLCTGGPAVQIVGELGQYNRPEKPRLQFQDWFKPWTDYTETTEEEDKALLDYCEHFYFGE